MTTVFFNILDTGHLSAMINSLFLISSSIAAGKLILRLIVVVTSASFSCDIFKAILISGISQPFLSIYIRKVDSVQDAKEDNSAVYGSGPRSCPPTLAGSSIKKEPFLHVIVHRYFCEPILPVRSFSNKFSIF